MELQKNSEVVPSSCIPSPYPYHQGLTSLNKSAEIQVEVSIMEVSSGSLGSPLHQYAFMFSIFQEPVIEKLNNSLVGGDKMSGHST